MLLLDEPTSALDPELVGEVLAVIRRTFAAQNWTLVIVTHEVRFARDVADQVLFLDGGVVAERGGAEVLADPQNERTRQFLAPDAGDLSSDAAQLVAASATSSRTPRASSRRWSGITSGGRKRSTLPNVPQVSVSTPCWWQAALSLPACGGVGLLGAGLDDLDGHHRAASAHVADGGELAGQGGQPVRHRLPDALGGAR